MVDFFLSLSRFVLLPGSGSGSGSGQMIRIRNNAYILSCWKCLSLSILFRKSNSHIDRFTNIYLLLTFMLIINSYIPGTARTALAPEICSTSTWQDSIKNKETPIIIQEPFPSQTKRRNPPLNSTFSQIFIWFSFQVPLVNSKHKILIATTCHTTQGGRKKYNF